MAFGTFTLLWDHQHRHLQNFSIFPNWNSFPLNTSSPLHSFLAPDNHHSTFCLYEFDCTTNITKVESDNIVFFWWVSST